MNSSKPAVFPHQSSAPAPAEDYAQVNKDFITKFKKENNVKLQAKLPSAIDVLNAQVIKDGCTLWDAAQWRKFMQAATHKFADYRDALDTLLSLCIHCSCEPWVLIKTGRELYGFKKFDQAECFYLRDHLAISDQEGSYEENPSSELAYEIDDDAPSSGKGKKRLAQTQDVEEEEEN